MDEMLEIIAPYLQGHDVEFHGKNYDLPPARMRPLPTRARDGRQAQ